MLCLARPVETRWRGVKAARLQGMKDRNRQQSGHNDAPAACDVP